MTGPEHYRAAERLLCDADEWMDADLGWKATLSTEERIARRSADLAAAQVHAELAVAAAAAAPLVAAYVAAPDDRSAPAGAREWWKAVG